MVEIDSETLFDGAAAVVTTIAVLFFLVTVEWQYSPVSKAALVIGFLAVVFAITQRTADQQLILMGYGVVVVSTVALFFEMVNTFEAGNTAIVFGLLVIAAVLFVLRTRLDEANHFMTGREATLLAGVLVALVVVVLLVDVATGSLAYELQTKSQVEVPETRTDEIRVASVVATNPTPLPERVETPNVAVCAAGNWSEYRPKTESGEPRPLEINADVQDGYDEHVLSYGSKTFPVRLFIESTSALGETFPVKRTQSCPDTTTGPAYIAIFEAPSDRELTRPV